MLPKPYALPAGATSRKAFRSHLRNFELFVFVIIIIINKLNRK